MLFSGRYASLISSEYQAGLTAIHRALGCTGFWFREKVCVPSQEVELDLMYWLKHILMLSLVSAQTAEKQSFLQPSGWLNAGQDLEL